ncbi:hypothetical protein KAH55_11195, partial [bacterium]|nr:hypothetical protein [bacterium]
ILYRLEIPVHSNLSCQFTDIEPRIQVNGSDRTCRETVDPFGIRRLRLSEMLGPGNHEIRVQSRK